MDYFKIEKWLDVFMFIPKLIHILWVGLVCGLVRWLGELLIYVLIIMMILIAIGLDKELSGTIALFIGLPLYFFIIYYLQDLDDKYKMFQ